MPIPPSSHAEQVGASSPVGTQGSRGATSLTTMTKHLLSKENLSVSY